LLIGSISLGIMFLSWRMMPKAITARADPSQALAIVENKAVTDVPRVEVGSGIYLGPCRERAVDLV
jgi:hypothetical protein